MAKLKKTARSAKPTESGPKLNLPPDLLPKSLADSAQQIWMAGMGAFQRAQTEGSKLFDALVKEGANFESVTRKLATGRVDAVRDAVEDRVGTVRERATDTWDRLEKVFEERVQRGHLLPLERPDDQLHAVGARAGVELGHWRAARVVDADARTPGFSFL